MVTIPPSEQWTAGDGASLGKVGLLPGAPLMVVAVMDLGCSRMSAEVGRGLGSLRWDARAASSDSVLPACVSCESRVWLQLCSSH